MDEDFYQISFIHFFIYSYSGVIHVACCVVNIELSCTLMVCPCRKRHEQILRADIIAFKTNYFVHDIHEILHLNSVLKLYNTPLPCLCRKRILLYNFLIKLLILHKDGLADIFFNRD